MSGLKAKIEYVIFDMDGLLSADTERIYTEVTNNILRRYGHEFTYEIKRGTMGKVARESAEHIYSFFPGLEEKLSVDDYLQERQVMQEELFRKVPPMRGAAELVKRLHAAGVPIALASGSNKPNYIVKTSHLPEIFGLFPADSLVLADSPMIAPGRGKPFPDIFLAAARTLGRDVGEAKSCTELQKAERAKGLVFEDATLGVQAGVSAGMHVVWVPDPKIRELDPDNTYGSTDILTSLDEFKPETWGLSI